MKILALTRYDRLGASSRVRFLQYIDYLQQYGVEITVIPLLTNNYIKALYNHTSRDKFAIAKAYLRRLLLLTKVHKFDLLWIEKELFPGLPAIMERLLHLLRMPYVVDYDDAIFHNYEHSSHGWVRKLLSKKIAHVMHCADLVVAGNPYIADYANAAHAMRVEYLPSVIDLQHYPLMAAPQNKILVIGWIGTPATAKYLQQIAPALVQVCQERNARLVAVGLTSLPIDNLPLELRHWSEETEATDIHSFDIGIMPLPDDTWTRGKCGYKLIQYMACAKPVIASPIGINQKIVRHGENGLLATTQEEWMAALLQLLDDADLRQRMGAMGRQIVEQEYCIQVTAPRLLAMLKQI